MRASDRSRAPRGTPSGSCSVLPPRIRVPPQRPPPAHETAPGGGIAIFFGSRHAMRHQFVRLVLGLVISHVTASWACGEGPADSLLRLVPADAGVTLTIEDLRGHTRDFFASPLAESLGRLPAVHAW